MHIRIVNQFEIQKQAIMNTHKKILLPLLLLAFAWGVAVAQPGPRDKGERPPRQAMSPDSMAQRQTERLTKLLELTPEQQKKVEKINLDAARDRAAMHDEMQKQQDRMHEKMEEKKDAQDKAYKSVLTEEQYQKLQELHQRGPREGMHERHFRSGKNLHRGKPGDREDNRPSKKG